MSDYGGAVIVVKDTYRLRWDLSPDGYWHGSTFLQVRIDEDGAWLEW